MTNLDKNDILEMIRKEDETPLVLHWTGSDDEPSHTDAKSIYQEIKEMAGKGGHGTEEDLWEAAYICTEEDYKVEQAEINNADTEI